MARKAYVTITSKVVVLVDDDCDIDYAVDEIATNVNSYLENCSVDGGEVIAALETTTEVTEVK